MGIGESATGREGPASLGGSKSEWAYISEEGSNGMEMKEQRAPWDQWSRGAGGGCMQGEPAARGASRRVLAGGERELFCLQHFDGGVCDESRWVHPCAMGRMRDHIADLRGTQGAKGQMRAQLPPPPALSPPRPFPSALSPSEPPASCPLTFACASGSRAR